MPRKQAEDNMRRNTTPPNSDSTARGTKGSVIKHASLTVLIVSSALNLLRMYNIVLRLPADHTNDSTPQDSERLVKKILS
ncbi:hypothetical protein E2C01_002034 [Portunus trituberculatus]|uniref:Uncharacterized protein n=1 Tax=Portunus trituberculatus TaxID=210409 RepID=A0A5B7CP99_PORTR|nr:hypothetical protein [Portunus trituberculatus]